MTNSQAERTVASMLYWAQESRRDEEMVARCLKGMSKQERAEVVAILESGELDALTDSQLLERMVGLASKVLEVEHKSVTAVDTGTFSGYLAVVGNRDDQGDTIAPGALDATVAHFKAGGRQWFLTDAHSEKASDVVAEILDAHVDSTGLRVAGRWMDTPAGQALRQMARGGAKLGLSIDYATVRYHPDGQGGRTLTEVAVFGGAVTPKPANGLAFITESKSGTLAQVVTVAQEIAEGAARRDPDRERLARMAKVVEAAGFPSPHLVGVIGVEAAYEMTMGVAQRKAAREVAADPERAAAAAKRDRDNAHSYGMAEAMVRLQAQGCGVCWSCQAGGRCVHAR